MSGSGNLRVAVSSSRSYDHATILVNAPPAEGEPSTSYQLCIVSLVVVAMKETSTYLRTESRAGVPTCGGQVNGWG